MLPAAEVGAELIPCQLQDSWEETKSINQKQVGKLGYFPLWHLCHKRKKSADSLRSLYFFGHEIGRQCLSSQWENSIECIECARICFQEPILRHLLLLKLGTYIFVRGLRGNGHRTNLFLQALGRLTVAAWIGLKAQRSLPIGSEL